MRAFPAGCDAGEATLDVDKAASYLKAMAIRQILTAPDPRLREVSKPVEAVTDEIRALMDDMLETMYDAPGIGLAAIQVGVPLRVIVMDLAGEEEEPAPQYFVNPEVLDPSSKSSVYQEGCLSVPEFFEEVERPETCRLKYLDYDGVEHILDAEGLFATCIQHEMDHLEGVLFIDHLSRLKRDLILRKLKKEQRLSAAE